MDEKTPKDLIYEEYFVEESLSMKGDYRGFSRVHNTWVYGPLVSIVDGDKKHTWILVPIKRNVLLPGTMPWGAQWYSVDPNTVGQYVGRKDVNGIKIYEDDLLKDYRELEAPVVWDTKQTAFVICSHDRKFDFEEFGHIEVVGNIYERNRYI